MSDLFMAATIHNADSRCMPELADGSVQLVVTSPPYWTIKDYGGDGQIGHGQSLHHYLDDLHRVWAECFRACAEGGRLCINVGDQFARAADFGRYRVIPLHAEIIAQCVALGGDYLGSIAWRKKTTMNTSGGAVIMGSYPYPPNGIVEIDFEYIMLFRKPGAARRAPAELKASAAMTRDEWKAWFSGHWEVAGARKKGHEAPFPEEIPRRLIRMFSLPGDLVLDPFLGTGTTMRVALALGRRAVGYEIVPAFARQALQGIPGGAAVVETRRRSARTAAPLSAAPSAWRPSVPDMAPPRPRDAGRAQPELCTVSDVLPDCSLHLSSGARVSFAGLRIVDAAAALAYLRERVLKRRVFLRGERQRADGSVAARVVLKNRINVNAQLVKIGAAAPSTEE